MISYWNSGLITKWQQLNTNLSPDIFSFCMKIVSIRSDEEFDNATLSSFGFLCGRAPCCHGYFRISSIVALLPAKQKTKYCHCCYYSFSFHKQKGLFLKGNLAAIVIPTIYIKYLFQRDLKQFKKKFN